MPVWKHPRAIFLLPLMVTVVIPGILLYSTGWIRSAYGSRSRLLALRSGSS